MFKVRVTWEGEVLFERDLESEILAAALYDSTVSDYRRRDDDVSEGVSVSLIDTESDNVRAEGTFAGGRFF